jgi:uncharacterized DUF497 family protein
MRYLRFEWNEEKNRYNIRKHGISFSEAISVFSHPYLARPDDREPYGEDRWLAIEYYEKDIGH